MDSRFFFRLFLASVLIFVSNISFAQLIARGQVVKQGENGTYPVISLPVSIKAEAPSNDGTALKEEIVYTDAVGIYLSKKEFKFGSYALSIWIFGFDSKPLSYSVEIGPPPKILTATIESDVLSKLSTEEERQFVRGLYDGIDNEYSLLTKSSMTVMQKDRLAEIFSRVNFSQYFDIAPIDISPDKISDFKKVPVSQ